MWHQWFKRNFTKLREYFLCAKKTKIMNLFNNSSPPCHPGAMRIVVYVVYALIWTKTTYPHGAADTEQHTLFTFSGYSPKWRQGEELLNKVVIFIYLFYIFVLYIFVFFTHKKYSRSFVKLWLNHWHHMDYFIDVLATFLDLDRVRTLAVYGRVRELSEFIKNILICVPKSYRFGTTQGWVMTEFSSLGELFL